jgi:beta-galactosidase
MLTADRSKIRANRDDLAYVMVTVVDDAGRTVPDATIPVTFSFSGSGELAAVGNANPKDVASFRQPRRSTYHGTCLAVLRPSGESGSMNLKAEAPGFEPASIVVKTA